MFDRELTTAVMPFAEYFCVNKRSAGRRFERRIMLIFSKMKKCLLFVLILAAAVSASAQTVVEKIVEAERAFAAMAEKNGVKAAFLANLSDDSIIFQPDRTNGKQYWENAKIPEFYLSWFPIYADASANGTVGYTTGPWEFRSEKGSEPTAFGDYVTVWEKRGDVYKAVVDIGIGHAHSAASDPGNVKIAVSDAKAADSKSYAGDAATAFYELIGRGMNKKAYKDFAAEDIRLFRDGKPPAVGKKAALELVGKGKLKITKRISFYGTGDLAYVTNRYQYQDGDVSETGNFLQIWKYRDGKWKIVIDVFVPLPRS